DGGCKLVAAGTPEDIAANSDSWTGKFLAETFRRHDERRAARNRRERAKTPTEPKKVAKADAAKKTPKPATKAPASPKKAKSKAASAAK
ncbi:MAG: excinuclease ABC subunit A, partial [Hyphomonas sp.]